jgi:hypothetical protein
MMQATISSMDDVRIGVINNGPVEPTWFYGGKAYVYKARTKADPGAITVVPWIVAQHHWGLGYLQDESGNIKIVRKDWKETNDRDSLLESRLGSICPKKFHKPNSDIPGQYIDDPEIKEWFLKRVTFKAKVIRHEMTEEEFNAG